MVLATEMACSQQVPGGAGRPLRTICVSFLEQILKERPTQLRMILSTAFVTLSLIYANEQNV